MTPGADAQLRVVRLCSVFEPPPETLAGRGVRFDPIGGMQNHTASLTRALDALGVQQQVVTTRPPGAPSRQPLGPRTVVHRRGLPVPWFRQGYALPAAVLVDRLARRSSLLHAHLGEDLAIVPIALAASRRHRIPWVLTIHTSVAHTFEGGGLRGAILRQAGGRLESAGVRRADAVIALTARTQRLLLEDGAAPDSVHVIPSGVVATGSAGPAGAARTDSRPHVLFVGRLAEQKGVRYLVEAAAHLQTPGVSVRLLGDGPERAMLERLAARLDVEDRVRFLGFRPHEDVPAEMARADVLVLPSVYEELGSVLLEGMQAGMPIVATRTGGIADAIGDAGVLVPPRDPSALAAALDALLADPARRQELSARARRRAAGYQWDELAARVLAVYRTVVR